MLLRAPAFRTIVAFVALGFVGNGVALRAKSGTDLDEKPVLLSTTGGGPKWTNLEELQRFAATGDPQACFQLAELLLEGVDLPKNEKSARALFMQAADGGIADGWFRLGKIYHDGLGEPRDYQRALEYFALAARAGVAEAQHNLGAMFASARGVRRNFVEGLAWLIVSAKSGVGSDAEEQVRARLANKPRDIRAAEARAEEILADLAHAEVPGVRSVKTEAGRPPAFVPRKIAPPAGATAPLENPTISINPTAPFSLPVAPTLGKPTPPKDKR